MLYQSLLAFLLTWIQVDLINGVFDFAFTKTEYGIVQGRVEKHNGQFAEVYDSLPYAKNPTGNQRFESPQSPEKWHRSFDTNFEIVCPQYHIVPAVYKIPINESENCLFLKVVIPLRDHKKRFNEKLPIVYWIHGMSYTKGGKYVYRTSGVIQSFSSKKTIFIAVDYRLGFDGFLSLHDTRLPGNFGLEDIIFGLEFVKRNAESFGGDPNRITLGGESVGGSLAGLIAASPRTKGLISGAMLFSGTTLTSWAQRNEFTKANSQLIIDHCNCTREDPREIKECMKMVDPKCYRSNLYLVKWEFLWDSPERLMYEILRMGFTLATPVIDDYRGVGAFLPQTPLNLVKSNDQKINFLISHVAHERATGMLYSVWGSQLPASYYVNAMVYSRTPSVSVIRKVLRDRYTPDGVEYDHTASTQLLTGLVQDELVSDGAREGKIYSEKGNDVYMIVSDVFAEPFGGQNMSLASEHCMDMVFLFNEPHVCNPLLVLSDEMKLRGPKFGHKLTDIIADFVHKRSIEDTPKYGSQLEDLLQISNENFKNGSLSADTYYFWQQLLPSIQQMNVTLPEVLPVIEKRSDFSWKAFIFGITTASVLFSSFWMALYYWQRRKRVSQIKK